MILRAELDGNLAIEGEEESVQSAICCSLFCNVLELLSGKLDSINLSCLILIDLRSLFEEGCSRKVQGNNIVVAIEDRCSQRLFLDDSGQLL